MQACLPHWCSAPPAGTVDPRPDPSCSTLAFTTQTSVLPDRAPVLACSPRPRSPHHGLPRCAHRRPAQKGRASRAALRGARADQSAPARELGCGPPPGATGGASVRVWPCCVLGGCPCPCPCLFPCPCSVQCALLRCVSAALYSPAAAAAAVLSLLLPLRERRWALAALSSIPGLY